MAMTETRPTTKKGPLVRLEDTNLNVGKRARMYDLLYNHGPANGTMMFLPIDQGLEHGPRDFFPNPAAADPEFELKLARDGHFTAIVYQIGIAQKYMYQYAGQVPLVLKLNGKTEIPSDNQPLSPLLAGVEDAVRLGALAVGYTLYVGSGQQAEDFKQFALVRKEAEAMGMPIIVWSYPRGQFVEDKGGKDSLYAIDYAARAAAELGADVIKINMPKVGLPAEKLGKMPKEYVEANNSMTTEEATRAVVQSVGRSFLLFSGGEKDSDADLISKVHLAMDSGATGLIFGRNMWQRPMDQALPISHQISEILKGYSA